MFFLSRQFHDRLDEALDELSFEVLSDPFESANHADQFGGDVFLLENPLLFCREQGFLPLLGQASGHAPPQDIFLKFRSFARKPKPLVADPPELLDADVVHGETKAGTEQETGEDEPGLLMFDRKGADVLARRQTGPKVAEQGRIPVAFGATENLLQALDDPGAP